MYLRRLLNAIAKGDDMNRLGLTLLSLFLLLDTAAAAPAGLTVCIGTDAAEQVSSQWKTPGCIVQCLGTDADKVEDLRKRIQASGVYGKVTARQFDGIRLPYIDNSVNRVVCAGTDAQCSKDEILRVLIPNGTAMIDGKQVSKPRPGEIDDWSHYHHNPAGTMVGGDTVVGPPRRLQWMGGPKWLRNHDFMSSMHAMVSSGGRVFYIIDEGLRNHIFLPSDWKLIARDAFNGTILWKQPLKNWQPHNWPLKSGPGDMPRRIVATPDTVYATAGLIEPLTAFDTRTGRIRRTYEGTDGTVEIALSDGTLFLLTDPNKQPVGFRGESTKYSEIGRANTAWAWKPESPQRIVMAVDADSGKLLWKQEAKVAPLTLTVSNQQVFFHNGNSLVALDRKNGAAKWSSDPVPVKSVPTGGSLRVVYSDGVTLFARGTSMTAFDAKTGKSLWTAKLQKTSHHCPEDMFVIGGQVWSPNTGKPQESGTHFKVFDLHTGNIVKDFVAENIKGFPMHPRCYPSRATERFIMTNGMGTEFYEIGGTKVDVNNTVRGSCIYGVMPANGLLYKPADTCACYYQSKLEYFCALAPERRVKGDESTVEEDRLQKGIAYGEIAGPDLQPDHDWPMYRRDVARSGYNPSPVSPQLQETWKVQLGGKLTQPVVADGKMIAAAVDQHTVYALDADGGTISWQFTAGGRIDSSPTLYQGTVLFGCTDGWAYCLRASDGALVWRYLVAPRDRQLLAFQQLESVWPVHGSLLVHNNVLYCLAGRNMFLDGGLRLAMLDAATGRELSSKMLDEKDPETGLNLQTLIEQKYMPVANADLFSCNGENLFMQTQKFDLEGNRINIAPIQPRRETTDMARDQHLFCPTGFLDTTWFHRSYWIYGTNCGEGWGAYANARKSNPAGRIMTLDDTRAYGFRSDPLGNMLHPRQTYVLFAAELKGAVTEPPTEPQRRGRRKNKDRDKRGGGNLQNQWQIDSPELLVNSMTLGGQTLFVAGPPDLADESAMFGFLPGASDDLNRQLQQQEEAWHGKHGGILWAVSAETGEMLGKYKLDTYPVFDGLITARGRLYMSMLDGSVRCFQQSWRINKAAAGAGASVGGEDG